MALNVNFLKKIEDTINNLKISNNNSGILNNPYVFCQENSAIRSLNSKQTYERKSKVFKRRKIWNWPRLPNNFETKNLASHLLSTISIYIATHSLPSTQRSFNLHSWLVPIINQSYWTYNYTSIAPCLQYNGNWKLLNVEVIFSVSNLSQRR